MMKNKPHLFRSANLQFDDAKEFEESNLKASIECRIDAHQILASFYMANDDEKYLSELNKAASLKLQHLDGFKGEILERSEVLIWPESQINYTFICLAINDFVKARQFISIDTIFKNSHKFDILLNHKLRQMLRAPLLVDEPKYNPTTSEVGLFMSLDSILRKSDVDWSLLDKYWRTTKSKRYKLTIFEDKDLFSLALRNFQKAFNDGFNLNQNQLVE